MGHVMGMGMTPRIVLAMLGVVAAAVIPMTIFRVGVSLFWSQALGIIIGSLPMYLAVTKREPERKAIVPWLMAMSIAMLVALVTRRVFGG